MPANRITAAVVFSLVAVATCGAKAERVHSGGPARGAAVTPEATGGSPDAAILPQMPSHAGTIVLKVTDYDAARQKLLDTAHREGAELLNSRTEVDYRGKQHGWVRLRLASDHLPLLLPTIHTLGKLY